MSQATSANLTSNTQAVVAVQGLTKTFKDFWMRTRAKAVDNLTFQVNRGEVFGLLGPNGSGKSTTIKIMLGLLRPTSGRVAVFGKPPTDVAIKRRIGYLPEESYLYPFLNARETLDYYGKLFQLDKRTREKRIDELLDMVGLASVQFRAVREYSKGMQRRIGIAQALINDPEFLILDEPTTGLDPIGNRQIKDLIIELGRRGKSILLSSHLLADVEDCVHRMVILYGGKKQSEGTCDELLARTDRSVIETDTLDEATISEIDALIRARSGGMGGIGRVSQPRQKLEELFMEIVERATKARLATSGAQAGGVTASFLTAEKPEGQSLINELLKTEPAARAAEATGASEPAKPAGPDASVLDALVAKPAAPAPQPASSTTGTGKPAAPAANVDKSVIDSLLGDGSPPGAKP
ncbi:MAG: ABC transporter ATP-binding protein [Phycisphaerales bacterium]